MSGTFPTSPKFNDLVVQSKQATMISRSISGRRQARQIGGQYWCMRAQFPPMTRAEFAPIYAFVISQRGSFDTFTITPPVISSLQGAGSGTPLVKGASQSGRSVNSDAWANSTLVLRAGDFIKFASHSKVYMVTADTTSDGSGDASISIEPALVETPSDNEAITYDNVPFTVSLTGNVQEFRTSSSGFYRYELDLEEVF